VSPAGGSPGHERIITDDPGESVITQPFPGLTADRQDVGSGARLALGLAAVAATKFFAVLVVYACQGLFPDTAA
jgi:hypothetical protein